MNNKTLRQSSLERNLSFIDIHTKYNVNYNIQNWNMNLQHNTRIEEIEKEKGKLQVNEMF
jgi:hypothetical protein